MAQSISIFVRELTDKVDFALMDAVQNDLKEALLKKVEQFAESEVYSYGATPRAMSSRRYTIGSKDIMDTAAGGGEGHFWLRITNKAYTQNPAGADESDIVEKGYSGYRQPYPRPFMEKALEDFVNSGEADRILRDVFIRHGI